MIRINQLKLDYKHTQKTLEDAIIHKLKISRDNLISYSIAKQSIDARRQRGQGILLIYVVDVEIKNETAVLKKIKDNNVMKYTKKVYHFPEHGKNVMDHRPVIVGMGPAGLFCGWMLAKEGYAPILLERGGDVDERTEAIEHFWRAGTLHTDTNVQFGEGGAGTFSDGKLNTLVKDKDGRGRFVLERFVEAGAPEDILYLNKPHIGTDRLRTVVKQLREEIKTMGGEVHFNAHVTDILTEDGAVCGVVINDIKTIRTKDVIVATGHSARDVFSLLNKKKCQMSAKSFAVGLRIQHPQEVINQGRYGQKGSDLPAADYKLTHQCKNGRSVYTFCMCPGGYVVNASSEEGGLVVNGMSLYARDSQNANSAVIVSVTPEDFEGEDPLAGVRFQQKWEKKAFLSTSNYAIPAQRFIDFKNHIKSEALGGIHSVHKGYIAMADLNECLPKEVCESIVEGVESFGHKIKSFDDPDAVLLGVETRTSSPVRIERNECFESNICGLYPCGEGAGYAGGIMSAAMDGIKVAEEIGRRYQSLQKQ